MEKMKSVFIEQQAFDWIVRILGNDIYKGFEKLGYICRKGAYEEYKGEDISFHMWWGQTQPHEDAIINAIFITHTDDKYKEARLLRMKDDFDFFFTMSPEDAQFLIELGFDENKVFGINLPSRNTYVNPMSIGIFSRCYPDRRKNEEWLYHFCESNPDSKLIDFVFIGDGWSDFVNRLAKLNCSFQWHYVSRDLPYEYMYQQLKLRNLDYYIYMGMDGGAMGTYDAYAMGVPLCVTDDGYHKSIPDIEYSFSNEREFSKQIGRIIKKQRNKIDYFKLNSVDNYVSQIAYIIENKEYPNKKEVAPLNYSVKDKRRSSYFKRGWLYGVHDYLYITFHNWLSKRKYNSQDK